MVLLNHLPRTSSFVQAAGGGRLAWGDSEHLLASLIDTMRVGNYLAEVQAAGLQFKGHKPKPPTAMARPSDETAPRRHRGRPVEELAPLLTAWREGRLEMVETTTEVS